MRTADVSCHHQQQNFLGGDFSLQRLAGGCTPAAFMHSCFGSVSAAAGVKKEIKKKLRKALWWVDRV